MSKSSVIPFGFIEKVREERSDYQEAKDMLKAFLKSLGFGGISKIMQQAEASVETDDLDALATAVQGCCGTDFQFALGVTTKSENLSSVMSGKGLTSTSPMFKEVLRIYLKHRNDGYRAVVLHKIKHLGVFVTTGPEIFKTSGPRIWIPSTNNDIEHLYMMPLSTWAAGYKQFN